MHLSIFCNKYRTKENQHGKDFFKQCLSILKKKKKTLAKAKPGVYIHERKNIFSKNHALESQPNSRFL